MELGITASLPTVLKEVYRRFHTNDCFSTEEKCRTDKYCSDMLNFVENSGLSRSFTLNAGESSLFLLSPLPLSYLANVANYTQPFLSALDDLPLEFELEPYMNLVQRFGFGYVSRIEFGYKDVLLGGKLYKRYGIKDASYQGPACTDPVPSKLSYSFNMEAQIRGLEEHRKQKLEQILNNILTLIWNAPTQSPTLSPTLAPTPPTLAPTSSPTSSPTHNAASSILTAILLSSILLLFSNEAL